MEKDAFDYAVSWRRAFYGAHLKWSWLQQYCDINKVAYETMVGMMNDKLFDNNVFQEKMKSFAGQLDIFNRAHKRTRKLVEDFADLFTDGDI